MRNCQPRLDASLRSNSINSARCATESTVSEGGSIVAVIFSSRCTGCALAVVW